MNQIVGTNRNDTLFGTEGADTITAGRGNDAINGLEGDDTYRFNSGFGSDRISQNPFGAIDYDTAFDQIRFGTGLNPDDVTVTRLNNDLYLNFASGEQLIVSEHFAFGRQQIDRITFGDGTIWYPWKIEQQIQPQEMNLTGTAGRDTLFGDVLNDTLSGGAGFDYLFGLDGNDDLTGGLDNDVLLGGNGNDTYRYNTGDGRDVIIQFSLLADKALGGGFDQLVFGAGISPDDVTVTRDEDVAVLNLGPDTEIFLGSQFVPEIPGDPNIDRIVFDDGTIWYPWKLFQFLTRPTVGDDNLSLSDEGGQLRGLAGRDTLEGGAGNDKLFGDQGTDRLTGGAGNDTLNGGAGNDNLDGGAGNDTYRFDAGFGFDVIDFTSNFSDPTDFDQIVFGIGISPDQVRLSNGDDTLVIEVGEDVILVSGYFLDENPTLGRVKFADGTIWYNWQILNLIDSSGTERADDLFALPFGSDVFGLGGNDTLYGQGGSDRLLGGAGDDLINSAAGNDTLIGGVGSDNLVSGEGNDTFEFAAGHGSDTVDARYGGGYDQIRFTKGVSSADIVGARSGDHLVLSNLTTGDTIRVESYFQSNSPTISRVTFRDGTIWYADQLVDLTRQANNGANELFGTDANDTINALGGDDLVRARAGDDVVQGGTGVDRLYGEGGNDQIIGGAGNDSLFGEAGNDTLNGGTGNDTMTGREGNDTYVFDAGFGTDTIINSAFGYSESDGSAADFDRIVFSDAFTPEDILVVNEDSNTLLLIASDGSEVRVSNHFSDADFSINEVSFADGTIWTLADLQTFSSQGNALDNFIQGTDARDTIHGMGGNDTLYGGGMPDKLYGGTGDDLLNGGSSTDRLFGQEGNDTLYGGRGTDFLDGGDGDDVIHPGKGDGGDTIDGGDGSDTLSLDHATFGYLGVDADISAGTSTNQYEYLLTFTNIENLTGTSVGDRLTGDDGDNVLQGLHGADVLNGKRRR